ncbi:fungal-specific transcription factor domain-containing protein [Trametes gibbosa]|nr:fungal-specific transcription factor domain-containing protein [Trametes gibbosa]UVI59115.1 Zn(2)-Cys(6)11 [Trametes gibbosa]
MSSPDEEGPGSDLQSGTSKRRKVLQRACDYCRRKKIKCDGPRMPNKRCSKCISRRTECTYVEPFNKPRYPDSYVESLEKRLQRMEELLSKLDPDSDLVKTLDNESTRDMTSPAGVENTPSPSAASTSSLRVIRPAITPSSPEGGVDDGDDFSDHDEVMRNQIVSGMAKLSLQPVSLRYHGKSSGWVFIQATEGFRQEYIRETLPPSARGGGGFSHATTSRKYERQPWIERPLHEHLFAPEDFPSEDLMGSLVNFYFRHYNDYTPLLHEPTFLQNIKEKLHLRIPGFGATVLLTCAIGARYSNDRRVLLERTDMWQSAGYKWFQKVDEMHKSLLASVHVYDVQIPALATLYMQTTILPHCSWIMIGVGLRKAMDIGAHRKSMYKAKPTVEDELWRRAFWVLVVLEWGSSYGLGRPPCLHEEEYDVALPTECDDEYWITDDPEQAFKQPPDKPSKVASWNCFIRLFKVIAYASRTIFSIRKSKSQMVNGDQQWEDRIVAELDSELNKWADTVPEHLKWNPNCENTLWLSQAATLHAVYCQVQITVHRSYLTSRRGSPHALASLIICTNAARSSVQVIDQLYQRLRTPIARNAGTLFNAGLVLLISMWGQRRSGRHAGADRDQEYVRKCIEMLSVVEREYNVAERLRDMLQNFLAVDVSRTSAPDSATQDGPDGPNADTIEREDVEQRASQESTGSNEAAPTTSSASSFVPPPRTAEQDQNDSSSATNTCGISIPSLPSYIPSQDFQRIATDPLVGSIPMSWPPRQPLQTSSSSVPNLPGFSFMPLDPTSQAWDGVPGANIASQMPNSTGSMAFYPSYGSSVPAEGGAFPMDMSGFGGALSGDGDLDMTGLPDCAFVDDTMTIWSNAPPLFAWQDWEAYFNTVSGGQQQSGS